MELDVDHVADLARLHLTPEEKDRLGPQLQSILQYVAHLQETNTEGIEATFQVMPLSNVMRDDMEAPCLPTAAALRNAPATEGDYFRMPRILES